MKHSGPHQRTILYNLQSGCSLRHSFDALCTFLHEFVFFPLALLVTAYSLFLISRILSSWVCSFLFSHPPCGWACSSDSCVIPCSSVCFCFCFPFIKWSTTWPFSTSHWSLLGLSPRIAGTSFLSSAVPVASVGWPPPFDPSCSLSPSDIL